jgi:hypothetical protein
MRPTTRPDLTDAHMLVLAVFAREPFACAEDVATALGVPVDVIAKLCADLEGRGDDRARAAHSVQQPLPSGARTPRGCCAFVAFPATERRAGLPPVAVGTVRVFAHLAETGSGRDSVDSPGRTTHLGGGCGARRGR